MQATADEPSFSVPLRVICALAKHYFAPDDDRLEGLELPSEDEPLLPKVTGGSRTSAYESAGFVTRGSRTSASDADKNFQVT